MSTPERATLRSPLRSPAAFVSAVHGRIRRHRLGRATVLVIVGTFVSLRLFGALGAAETERARWSPTSTVWVTTVDIPAGALVDADDVMAVAAPPGLVPAAAVVANPAGQRARVALAAGEIVITDRVIAELSANAARTPTDAVTIALDRSSDLFSIGDRVDLHDQLDGGRLASGLVVAVTDRDLGVAISEATVAEVIRGMGRGGVVAVLRGD
jgi:hypothetical protein